jgi:7-cyano-7-deazaguanine synthase
MENMNKQAVLSLSGGMDSSTVLLRLLADGYEVTALSFDYGQKHKVELERAQSLVDYLNSKRIGTLPTGDLTSLFHKINYGTIKLDGLAPMLNSALVEGGNEVPEGHYENENMKETVVPNRNKIFSSIIQAVALSKANEKDTEVHIAMGIHAGDHAIYPDCRQEFRDADYHAFTEGNWEADRVKYVTPYLNGDKFDILVDGAKCCNDLYLDFNKVYSNTNTSYKPINIGGKWFSDYKSASSVERVEAFIKLGRPDPCEYADESGPVSWDIVKSKVQKVLESV